MAKAQGEGKKGLWYFYIATFYAILINLAFAFMKIFTSYTILISLAFVFALIEII